VSGEEIVGAIGNFVIKPLSIALVGAVGLILGRYFFMRKKRKFFGLDRFKAASLRIALSNLDIQPKGTRGVIPLRFGYSGDANTIGEYSISRELADTLDKVPLSRWLSNLGLLKGHEFTAERLCSIEHSPSIPKLPRPMFNEEGRLIEDSGEFPAKAQREMEAELGKAKTTILVGSPMYNSVSDYLLGRCRWTDDVLGRVRFVRKGGLADDSRYCLAVEEKGQWTVLERREPGVRPAQEHFIVAKVVRPQNFGGGVTFLCCGTSVRATVWAVKVLGTEWSDLCDTHGQKPFCRVYSLVTNDPEYEESGMFVNDEVAIRSIET